MGTEEFLLKNYGPLLTISQLACMLSRSADGLRISLARESEWARRINQTRVKVGRRVYFRTGEIASLFDGKADCGAE